MTSPQPPDDEDVEDERPPGVWSAPHELSMVYGGGGVFGIAFGLGVAHGLIAAGIPVSTAPALGTSAGSWVASAIALGVPYDAFAEMEAPRVPTTNASALVDAGTALFGEARHPLVAASAVNLRSRRRHILDGGRYRLADLVAASSAVPGLFPPHRIDGRLYLDGGMWSATSVDAAANAHSVIVVAPLAGRLMGPMGLTAGFLLDRELRGWRDRHPNMSITMIRPDHAIARMAGFNPLGLFDADRARPVYPRAVALGRQWGEETQGAAAA